MPIARVCDLDIAQILPNRRQPRTTFREEAVDELAASIKEVGILQPLVVRPLQDGKFELIAGERRLRACVKIGLRYVPAIVREANDETSLELALIENLQRQDISPMESARAYRVLMDEFHLTQEQVSAKVGKSRVAIANTVRLLRLPEKILSALEEGVITEAHARALLGFRLQAEQLAVFDRIVRDGMTVKAVERLASEVTAGPGKKPKPQRPLPQWDSLSEQLSTRLGAPVKLEGSDRKGQIVIEFYSEDDLVRIVDKFGLQ